MPVKCLPVAATLYKPLVAGKDPNSSGTIRALAESYVPILRGFVRNKLK